MCVTQTLLRIPDHATADALPREKLIAGDWAQETEVSSGRVANAADWALMLTGTLAC